MDVARRGLPRLPRRGGDDQEHAAGSGSLTLTPTLPLPLPLTLTLTFTLTLTLALTLQYESLPAEYEGGPARSFLDLEPSEQNARFRARLKEYSLKVCMPQ